jgi:surface antigen
MASWFSLRGPILAALVLAAWGGAGSLAEAQVINPFSRSSLELSAEDDALMREAIRGVLESGKADTSESWTNPKTGLSGTATLLRVFDRDGAPCGEVEHTFQNPGGARYVLPFCRVPDGKWKIAL